MASVRITMVALVLPVVVTGFAVLTGVALTRMGGAQRDAAQERAEQTAKALAGSADRLPNTALQAARSIAAASAAFRSPDRRRLQAQIAAAAQLTPDVLDTWVVFDPGTAPGRDADWRGRPGTSGSGRFCTLYTHGGENTATPFP